MSPTVTKRLGTSFNDVGRSVKIRFTNFQVDDTFALRLQGFGTGKHFKGAFGAKSRHPIGILIGLRGHDFIDAAIGAPSTQELSIRDGASTTPKCSPGDAKE